MFLHECIMVIIDYFPSIKYSYINCSTNNREIELYIKHNINIISKYSDFQM